jgi:hypothetical protein
VRLEGGSGTGGQGQFLTRIVAPYQAILDIVTSLSLNKLFGFNRAVDRQLIQIEGETNVRSGDRKRDDE